MVKDPHLLLIGDSAGGLESIISLLDQSENLSDFAIVIKNQLSLDQKNALNKILSKRSDLQFKTVRTDQSINGGIIHLPPPGKEIKIINNKIKLYDPSGPKGSNSLIDHSLKISAENIPGIIGRYQILKNGKDRFFYLNKKESKSWGVHINKQSGNSQEFWKIVYEEDKKALSNAFLESKNKNKEIKIEFRTYDQDKNIQWKQLFARPSKLNDESTVWYCQFFDISQRKESEFKLKEQEALFQNFLKSFEGLTLKYRLYSDQSDEILYISPEVEAIHGISVEEAMKKPSSIWDQIYPEDIKKVQNKIQRSAKETQEYHVDYRIETKRGDEKWIRGYGKVNERKKEYVEWDIFTWDITKEKKSTLELEKKNAELNNILENSQDIICLANSDNYFIKVNRAATEILGYSAKELKSKPFTHFVHPEDRVHTKKEAVKALKSNGSLHFKNRYIAKDGQIVWLSWNSIIDKKNDLSYATARDITKDKSIELEREAIYRQSNLGTWDYDVINDMIFWSKNTKKVLGYVKAPSGIEQLTSLVKEGHFREELSETVKKAIKTGKSWDLETLFKIKGKGYRWIRSIGQPIIEEGRTLRISGTVQDIHDRKTTEISLSKLNSRQKDILDSISEAFFSLNDQWEVLYWNKVAEKMSGISENKMTGRNIWKTYPDSKWKDKFLECKRKEKKIIFEAYSYYWKIWCRVTVNPVNDGFSVFIQDVNDSVQYLNEIKAINERFELALQVTKDAIFDWNVNERQIKWNNAIVELTGYSFKELPKGLNQWLKKVEADKSGDVLMSLQTAFTSMKKKSWNAQFQASRKDGKEITIKVEGNILRNKEGKVIRMVGAARDISAQANSENQLKQLNKELVKKALELESSNEELEQFAYVASHDLQEPARMITSFMGLLKKNYGKKLDGKANQYIDFASNGGKRMRSMINDLLEYSRVGRKESKKTVVPLKEVVDEVKILQSRLLEEKKARIKCSKLPSINAQKSILVQLFGNLINNALKYSKEGTRPEIDISSKSSKHNIEIRVKDNGIGIAPKYHEDVFLIFKKLDKKKQEGSTGLGLAIVKKIVKKLEGNIYIESQEGKGSTFVILLPKSIKS